MVDSQQVKALVAEQLAMIEDAARADALCALLLPEPRLEVRAWDYGAPDERYPYWVVAEARERSILLVYCEQGFGPSSHGASSLSRTIHARSPSAWTRSGTGISRKRSCGPDSGLVGWAPMSCCISHRSSVSGQARDLKPNVALQPSSAALLRRRCG